MLHTKADDNDSSQFLLMYHRIRIFNMIAVQKFDSLKYLLLFETVWKYSGLSHMVLLFGPPCSFQWLHHIDVKHSWEKAWWCWTDSQGRPRRRRWHCTATDVGNGQSRVCCSWGEHHRRRRFKRVSSFLAVRSVAQKTAKDMKDGRNTETLGIHRVKWRHISVVAIRWPFCR